MDELILDNVYYTDKFGINRDGKIFFGNNANPFYEINNGQVMRTIDGCIKNYPEDYRMMGNMFLNSMVENARKEIEVKSRSFPRPPQVKK